MTMVVTQPTTLSRRPLVRSPIAARSFETSTTRTSSAAAIKPLRTALSEIAAYFIILATGSSVIITRAPSTQP